MKKLGIEFRKEKGFKEFKTLDGREYISNKITETNNAYILMDTLEVVRSMTLGLESWQKPDYLAGIYANYFVDQEIGHKLPKVVLEKSSLEYADDIPEFEKLCNRYMKRFFEQSRRRLEALL